MVASTLRCNNRSVLDVSTYALLDAIARANSRMPLHDTLMRIDWNYALIARGYRNDSAKRIPRRLID